jgi:transcriptional regulator with GAF, ATPase, and Fis domain
LALFELARVGLGAHELGERLLVMVEIVARSLGHDVAQLWLLRGGGSLRLRAAHPRESLVLEIARPRDHVGLSRVLDGEPLRVKGPSLRSWIRRTTRELLVAPLRAGEDVAGVLALGRFSREYSDEDFAMAAQCADVLARIVAADVTLRRAIATAARETAETTEDEDSLTGS